MSDKTGNVVIAGADVAAGFDNDPDGPGDIERYGFALVVEFKTAYDMRKAIQEGHAEFTVFGG